MPAAGAALRGWPNRKARYGRLQIIRRRHQRNYVPNLRPCSGERPAKGNSLANFRRCISPLGGASRLYVLPRADLQTELGQLLRGKYRPRTQFEGLGAHPLPALPRHAVVRPSHDNRFDPWPYDFGRELARQAANANPADRRPEVVRLRVAEAERGLSSGVRRGGKGLRRRPAGCGGRAVPRRYFRRVAIAKCPGPTLAPSPTNSKSSSDSSAGSKTVAE